MATLPPANQPCASRLQELFSAACLAHLPIITAAVIASLIIIPIRFIATVILQEQQGHPVISRHRSAVREDCIAWGMAGLRYQ